MKILTENFYSVDIYALDDENEIHCISYVAYCENQAELNAHTVKSIQKVLQNKFSIFKLDVNEATDEAILHFIKHSN